MTDFLRGSEIVTADVVRAKITATPVLSAARVTLHDGAYIDMNGKLRQFLFECRDWFGNYKVDAKDCDKATRRLLGVVSEKVDEDDYLPESPLVAWMDHWPIDGKYHAAALVLDAGQLWSLEPQRKRELIFRRVEDCVRQAVEIWG